MFQLLLLLCLGYTSVEGGRIIKGSALQVYLNKGNGAKNIYPNEYCRFEGQYLPHPHSPCHFLRCGRVGKNFPKDKELKNFMHSAEYSCPTGTSVDDRIFSIMNNYIISNPCRLRNKKCVSGPKAEHPTMAPAVDHSKDYSRRKTKPLHQVQTVDDVANTVMDLVQEGIGVAPTGAKSPASQIGRQPIEGRELHISDFISKAVREYTKAKKAEIAAIRKKQLLGKQPSIRVDNGEAPSYSIPASYKTTYTPASPPKSTSYTNTLKPSGLSIVVESSQPIYNPEVVYSRTDKHGNTYEGRYSEDDPEFTTQEDATDSYPEVETESEEGYVSKAADASELGEHRYPPRVLKEQKEYEKKQNASRIRLVSHPHNSKLVYEADDSMPVHKPRSIFQSPVYRTSYNNARYNKKSYTQQQKRKSIQNLYAPVKQSTSQASIYEPIEQKDTYESTQHGPTVKFVPIVYDDEPAYTEDDKAPVKETRNTYVYDKHGTPRRVKQTTTKKHIAHSGPHYYKPGYSSSSKTTSSKKVVRPSWNMKKHRSPGSKKHIVSSKYNSYEVKSFEDFSKPKPIQVGFPDPRQAAYEYIAQLKVLADRDQALSKENKDRKRSQTDDVTEDTTNDDNTGYSDDDESVILDDTMYQGHDTHQAHDNHQGHNSHRGHRNQTPYNNNHKDQTEKTHKRRKTKRVHKEISLDKAPHPLLSYFMMYPEFAQSLAKSIQNGELSAKRSKSKRRIIK